MLQNGKKLTDMKESTLAIQRNAQYDNDAIHIINNDNQIKHYITYEGKILFSWPVDAYQFKTYNFTSPGTTLCNMIWGLNGSITEFGKELWFRQSDKTTTFAETQLLLSVELPKNIEHDIFYARDKNNHYVLKCNTTVK